jgi:signal peptidase I
MQQQQAAAYEARMRRAHLLREIIEVVLLVGIVIFVIQLGIKSSSVNKYEADFMKHTLSDGQLLIVSKLSYAFGSPQRGDIVLYDNPLNTAQQRIQRVIGVPGDTVAVSPTSVSVNGHVLKETYITIETGSPENPGALQVKLGANQYFVLNDDRSLCDSSVTNGQCTNDSRNPAYVGAANPATQSLDRKYIVGKVALVWWPLNQIHGFDTYSSTYAGLGFRPVPAPFASTDLTFFGVLPAGAWLARRRG